MEPSREEQEKIQELKILLKERLATENDLTGPVRLAISKYGGNSEFLLKFLRGKKLKPEKASNSIIAYANIRYNRYPEVFPEEAPHFVPYAFERGIITILKQKDDLGRTVILFRGGGERWDVSAITLEELFVVGRYLVDILMDDPDFLTNGLVLVMDCGGARLSHARQFTIRNAIKFLNLFWQTYPLQIKGIYHVNIPLLLRPLFILLHPFVPYKLRNRMLYTSGVKELHKLLSPDILPESLGGALSDEEAISSISTYQINQRRNL